MATKQEYKDALREMVDQFAYRSTHSQRASIHTGGLSALENAFEALGLSDPHPVPEQECEWDTGTKYGKCHKFATSLTETPDGMKRLCPAHYRKVRDNEQD